MNCIGGPIVEAVGVPKVFTRYDACRCFCEPRDNPTRDGLGGAAPLAGEGQGSEKNPPDQVDPFPGVPYDLSFHWRLQKKDLKGSGTRDVTHRSLPGKVKTRNHTNSDTALDAEKILKNWLRVAGRTSDAQWISMGKEESASFLGWLSLKEPLGPPVESLE